MPPPEPPVLQTCWTVFLVDAEDLTKKEKEPLQDGKQEQGLCKREGNCLTLFMESGAVHYIPLPFLVRHMTPLTAGLLVERDTSGESGSGGLPTLFSLLHPMSDLCSISLKHSPGHTAGAGTALGYMTDPHHHVVGSCHQSCQTSLLLLYNEISGTHSIWQIRPATAEDVPAHVTTSTPHHQRRAHNSTVTPTPRSTSAPSQYDLRHTPRQVETPVQMVLTGNNKTRPHHLQKASALPFSGGGGGAGAYKFGSGRSPFITRLQTPVTSQKRSKSVSPPLLGRISPFSQTVYSNSWSTFYTEESAVSLEPLLPQLCMSLVGQIKERSSVATLFFSCDSLANAGPPHYLYYLTPLSSHLWVLPYKSDLAGVLSDPIVVPATHAIPIPSLSVVLVLSPTGEVSVHSGTLKVCTLETEWLFRNGDDVTGDSGAGDDVKGGEQMEEGEGRQVVVALKDGKETGFTVKLSSGRTRCCSLPQLYALKAVELFFKAIEDILPPKAAHLVLTNYYSTCIHLSPSSLSLNHFQHWLSHHLGLSYAAVTQKQPIMNNMVPSLQLLDPTQLFEKCTTTTQLALEEPTLVGYRHQIFMVLNLVYEELKLFITEASSLPELACFLHQLATTLGGLAGYCDHYQTDYPSLLPHKTWESRVDEVGVGGEEDGESGRDGESESPPHILNWLHSKLRGEEVTPFPSLSVCARTAKVIKLYGLYSTPAGENVSLSSLLSTSSISDAAVAKWEQIQCDSSLPHERVVLGMLAEGFTHDDLDSLPVGVALPLWDAILRCQEHAPPTWKLAAYDIIGREDIVQTLHTDGNASGLIMESSERDDGMTVDQEVLKLHFPKDLRVNEVRKMLNSSQPVKIALEQKPEVSDHEFIEQQELALLAVCQRTMTLPVGRGMFTLATAKPLVTSRLTIPPLELTGKAPPRNSTVGLEHIEKPVNMTMWAEFHNGVAAGLRIAPSGSKLDSTWILSNRSSVPPSSTPQGEDNTHRNSTHHAGVLLALGLTGHLTALMEYELFEYLQDKHELTTIAVLLGITAARVGSMQRSVASILSIFVPPLLPFGAADMEVSQSVQTAGLAGMGLLYMGSGNRHLTEIMLREIGHIPGPELEFAEDRESYALAAGLALGMITLGHGGDLPGMGDLRLVERLSVLISGGPKREMLCGAAPQGSSHLVLEPPMVNTHVTSPAATVALGLMYLKTNDSSVASRLDAPATLYELESIRNDFFVLRAASRGLIMWADVKPTQEWINGNIPEIVQKHAFQGSLGKGVKQDPAIDYQTLSQALVCISAGCCMAVGLRYAGTCDQQAHAVLMKNIRFLLSKMESSSSAEEAGKSCLEMCLNAVLLSVAMVMSGSGDLEVLRVIRRLHARVTCPEVTYGNHMASHMALGLLFLGGCRYSLSRSNQAIASLYASLFPLFPSSSTDSRYHLQALRHLYVLAAEPRVLVTRDVETGQARSVKVCIRGNEEMKGQTPCIVPEWASICEIEICSPDYWPITLDLKGEENRMRQILVQSGTVFVRHKTGGFREQLAQGSLPPSLSPHIYNTCNVKGQVELSEEVADNPLLKCPYTHLLSPANTQDSMWQRFLCACLLECVAEEKLPVFPSLLYLEKLSRCVLSPTLPHPTTQLWQLKLAWALAARAGNETFQLLHAELARVQLLRVKHSLYQFSDEMGEERAEEVLRGYLMGGEVGEGEIEKREREWLAANLVVYDIPPRRALSMTTQTTVPQLLTKVQSLHAPPSAVVRLLPLMKSQLPRPLNLPFL